MSNDLVPRTLSLFATRLSALAAQLEKAEAQFGEEGRDLSEIVASKLAPDMFAFPWQIVFACNQPQGFIAWLRGNPSLSAPPEPMLDDWQALKDYVAGTLAKVEAARTDGLDLPSSEKRIDLKPIGMHMVLPAQRYVDDWLMPNFYFHLTTSYSLMRMMGIALGKADFLTYIGADLRPDVPAG